MRRHLLPAASLVLVLAPSLPAFAVDGAGLGRPARPATTADGAGTGSPGRGAVTADTVPSTAPTPPRRVLFVQPWRSEQPVSFPAPGGPVLAARGYLVVLEADPRVLVPTAGAGPRLVADGVAARLVNTGVRSGRVVALLPAEGPLADALVWWTEPVSLARLDAAGRRGLRERAMAAGVRPLTVPRLERPLEVADMDALYRAGAELVLRFAPQEEDRARSLLEARPGGR